MTKNKQIVALLDFDDCHKDYLVYDLAVFISFNLVHKKTGLDKLRTQLFLNAYQKKAPLQPEEKKALYYFILLRFIGILNKTANTTITNWIKEIENNYLAFKKTTIEEFLLLC